MWYIYNLIILFERPPCPDGMRIVGRWCSTFFTEAKDTWYSVPELVMYFRFLLFTVATPWESSFTSLHHSSLLSPSVATSAASRAPARSIPTCFHHRITTLAHGALSNPFHRSNSDSVAMYFATVICCSLMYSYIIKNPAFSIAVASEVYIYNLALIINFYLVNFLLSF